jgi:hypothetical protein
MTGIPAGLREFKISSAQAQGESSDLGISLLERVTGIEPALSAWEFERITPSQGLTCQFMCPVMTALHRW